MTDQDRPAAASGCNIVIDANGPYEVMATCRNHGVIARDNILCWDYLEAMVRSHKDGRGYLPAVSAQPDGGSE